MAKASLLVVDDEPLLGEVFTDFFGERGYEVATAVNVSEAFVKVAYASYDIIFLDIKMPVLTGVEALEEMKSHQPQAKIIIMTGYWDQTTFLREKAEQVGVYRLIEKPFEMEDILPIVEEALASPERNPERL